MAAKEGLPRSGSAQNLAQVGRGYANGSDGGYAHSSVSNGGSGTGTSGSSGEEESLGGASGSHAPSVDGEQQWRGNSFQFKVRGKVINPGGEDTHLLSLKLRILDRDGICRTVEFPYNMEEDSAYSVANEMVEDLDLSPEDVDNIALKITHEVEALARDNTGELPALAAGRTSPPAEAAGRTARSSADSMSHDSARDVPREMEVEFEREVEQLLMHQRKEEEDLRRAHHAALERLRADHGRRIEQCRAEQLHAAIVSECTLGPKTANMQARISQMESLALDGLRTGKGKKCNVPASAKAPHSNGRAK